MISWRIFFQGEYIVRNWLFFVVSLVIHYILKGKWCVMGSHFKSSCFLFETVKTPKTSVVFSTHIFHMKTYHTQHCKTVDVKTQCPLCVPGWQWGSSGVPLLVSLAPGGGCELGHRLCPGETAGGLLQYGQPAQLATYSHGGTDVVCVCIMVVGWLIPINMSAFHSHCLIWKPADLRLI